MEGESIQYFIFSDGQKINPSQSFETSFFTKPAVPLKFAPDRKRALRLHQALRLNAAHTGSVYLRSLAAFGLPARKGWAFGRVPRPACTNRRLSALGTFPAVFVIAIAPHYTRNFLFVKHFFEDFAAAWAISIFQKKPLTNKRREYNIVRVLRKREKRIEKALKERDWDHRFSQRACGG